MDTANLDRILAGISEHDRVLDVGGWAAPFNRADAVLDLLPYETRGALLADGLGPGPERFSADTWVQRDICDHEPWPFADDSFDFVFCTHTLEDIRDPLWVCREMSRVGRRGYAEVPSAEDELTWRVPEPSGGDWLGHLHHRWICLEEDGGFVFLMKAHSLHAEPRVRVDPERAARFTEKDRGLALFWEGDLPAREWAAIDAYPYDDLARIARGEPWPADRSARATRDGGRMRAWLRGARPSRR